jgi:hypothetical protein
MTASKPLITFNPDGTLTVAVGPLSEVPGQVASRFPEPCVVTATGVAVFMVPGVLDVMIQQAMTELKAKVAASPDPKTGRTEDLMSVAAMRTTKELYDQLLVGHLPEPADLAEAALLDGWALIGLAGAIAPAIIGRTAAASGDSARFTCIDGVMAGELTAGGFILHPSGYVRLGRPASPEAGLMGLLLAPTLH